MVELIEDIVKAKDVYERIDSHGIHEIFIPYSSYLNSLGQYEIEKYKVVLDTITDSRGIYFVMDFNDHNLIDWITTSVVDNHLYAYGVCDNASQVFDNFEVPEKSVIFLIPVFKSVDDGWRWEKWGKYYGIQNSVCDYIGDEPDIELVYCFSIITLK